MAHNLRPYWLIATLFLLGASLVVLAAQQGAACAWCSAPSLEWASTWGRDGSVIRYAGMVLIRSLDKPYTITLIYAYGVILIYCVAQTLGLWTDRRRLRLFLKGAECRSLSPALAGLVSRLMGRPIVRYTQVRSWTLDDWKVYLSDTPAVLQPPVSLAVQMFPLLGFLGTVAGIASALVFLPTPENPNASVDKLTASLYTAFDTTFIGLVASLSLMLIAFFMAQSWARLQNKCTGGADQAPSESLTSV